MYARKIHNELKVNLAGAKVFYGNSSEYVILETGEIVAIHASTGEIRWWVNRRLAMLRLEGDPDRLAIAFFGSLGL